MIGPGPSTMRAVVTDQATPGRLTLATVERPEGSPADAIVRVSAISLNRGEVKTALAAADGWRPGWDFAGRIERAAQGGRLPVGTRVVGLAPMAAWAEVVAAPEAAMAAIPEGVSDEDAATLPVAGLTARAALGRVADLAGRRALVSGASGGVGIAAVQLAHIGGAHVTAALRNPAHAALLRDLGADEIALGDDLSGAAGPYDLILESVGGESLARAMGLLAPGGTCLLFGATAGAATSFDAARFRVGGTSLYGLVMGYEFQREPPGVGLAALLDLMAAGRLRAVIGRRASMDDIASAADDLMQRRFIGKAVLRFWSPSGGVAARGPSRAPPARGP